MPVRRPRRSYFARAGTGAWRELQRRAVGLRQLRAQLEKPDSARAERAHTATELRGVDTGSRERDRPFPETSKSPDPEPNSLLPEALLELDRGLVTHLLDAELSKPTPSKRVRYQLERVLSDLTAVHDIEQNPVTADGHLRVLLAYQPLSAPLSLRYRTTPDLVRYVSAIGAPLREAKRIIIRPAGMRLDVPWAAGAEEDGAAIVRGCDSVDGGSGTHTFIQFAMHRSPQSIREAADPYFAELAAPEFATWCAGIRDAAPDAEIVLLGFSYGGTIAAQALPWLDTLRRKHPERYGNHPIVKRVAFAGAPGLGRGFELRGGRHVHSERGPILHRGHVRTIDDLGAAADGIEMTAVNTDRDLVACFDRAIGRGPYDMPGMGRSVNIGHDTRLRDIGLPVHSTAAAALQAAGRVGESLRELYATVTDAHLDYARPGTAAHLATCAALTGGDPSRFHTEPQPGAFAATKTLLRGGSEAYGSLFTRLDGRRKRFSPRT